MTSHDPDDRLANLLGALVLALSDEINAATEVASGYSGSASAALVALHDLLRGRSVNDLRNAVDLTHSGGVRLVDRLVTDGLATRHPGADARSVSLTLTTSGRRVAARTREARGDVLRRALAGLSARERVQLTAITEKLIDAVVDERLEARAHGQVPPGGWLCRLCDPVACGRPDGECPAAIASSRPR